MEKKIEITNDGGLKCDNINCDWVDKTIAFNNYQEWINKPCPKCGENVLTEEDYKNAEVVRLSIDLINSMSKEELDKFIKLNKKTDFEDFKNTFFAKDAEGIKDIKETDYVEVKISTHKEIKIEEIKKIDKNENT